MSKITLKTGKRKTAVSRLAIRRAVAKAFGTSIRKSKSKKASRAKR